MTAQRHRHINWRHHLALKKAFQVREDLRKSRPFDPDGDYKIPLRARRSHPLKPPCLNLSPGGSMLVNLIGDNITT